MNISKFHPVIKTIFLFAVAIVGFASAFVFELDSQYNSSFGFSTRYPRIVWFASAFVLFLTVLFVLRITKVRWMWSILGGVLAIVTYSLIVNVLFYLLDVILSGLLAD